MFNLLPKVWFSFANESGALPPHQEQGAEGGDKKPAEKRDPEFDKSEPGE